MNASGAGRHGWAQTNSANRYRDDCGVCVSLRMHVRACAGARACGRGVFAIYDNNI